MDFSKNVQEIISAIDVLAKEKLNFREDLGRLIEMAYRNNKMDLLQDLSFQSKYSLGLLKIVQNRDNKIEEEYFSKVQNEFTKSIQKIKSSIESIISSESDFIKQIFNEKYFEMTQTSFSNLNKLCTDLGFVKLYFNDLKRK